MTTSINWSFSKGVTASILASLGFAALLVSTSTAGDQASNDSMVEVRVLVSRVNPELFGLHDRITTEIVGTAEALRRTMADSGKIVLLLNGVPLRGLCTNLVVLSNSAIVTNITIVRIPTNINYRAPSTKDVVTTNNGIISLRSVLITNSDFITNSHIVTNLGAVRLEFALERNEVNKAEWTRLLGSPKSRELAVTIAIGLEADHSIRMLGEAPNRSQLIILPNQPILGKQNPTVRSKRNLTLFAGTVCILGLIIAGIRKGRPGGVLEGWTWVFWAILLASIYLCYGPTWCWIAFAVLFLVGFLFLARQTEMLRDSGPQPPDGKLRPYSLARTQMAIWFALIISAYVFIWLMTNALDTISATLLALMGIGAGTALGAEAQDGGKLNKLKTEKELLLKKPENDLTKDDKCRLKELERLTLDVHCLEEEQQKLNNLVREGPERLKRMASELAQEPELLQEKAALQALISPTPQQLDRLLSVNGILAAMSGLRTALTELQAKLISVPARIVEIQDLLDSRPVSKGFFEDILTDNVGISFHRFQMFVWTMVLGVIFVVSVYESLAMPEFNETLLALMGISSGTYLGFMIAEPRT